MASTHDSDTDQRVKAKAATGTSTGIRDIRRKEIEEILRNAAKPAEAQLVLNLKATITREDIASLPPPGDRQNPELAHKLYYKTLGRLRRRYLLHNREITIPEEARRDFNKEVVFFLKKGESEADSRMAETKTLAAAVNIFVKWMEEHHEGETPALYHMFCEANNSLEMGKKNPK